MIINSLIAGVKKYFTSLSVDSIWGYKKIALLEIDDNKMPTGVELEIDATSNIGLSITKEIMQYPSESKKVYMDGTRINPIKMTIDGDIEITKLAQLQEFASDDKWFFVSMTKDIGGSYISMDQKTLMPIGRAIDRAVDIATSLFGDNENIGTQLYADCKPYVISNLSINDEGFINTVNVTIELTEVVLFEYDVQYKYGTKQTNPKTKKPKIKQTQKVVEVREAPWEE